MTHSTRVKFQRIAISIFVMSLSLLAKRFAAEKRLRNDLFCVEWDVKP